MINISIDSRELNRFLKNVDNFTKEKQEAVKKEIHRATYEIQGEAKRLCPFDMGFLKNSIDAIIKNRSLTGQVIVKRNYGIYVHEGTKPHKIMVKHAKSLAYQLGKGKSFSKGIVASINWQTNIKTKKITKASVWVILGKSVNHPGTKANPFLAKAVDKERPIYQRNLINIFNEGAK